MHGFLHAGRRAGAAARMLRAPPRWPPCGRGRPLLPVSHTDSLGVSFRTQLWTTGSKVAVARWTMVGVPPTGQPL